MIIQTAAARANVWMLSEFESKNNEYLEKLIEDPKVQVRRFPGRGVDGIEKIFRGSDCRDDCQRPLEQKSVRIL